MATCLVLGLIVGSFLNVVIYRLPVMLRARSGAAADAADCCSSRSAPRPAATGRARARARFNLVGAALGLPACKAPITALAEHSACSASLAGSARAAARTAGRPISVRYPLVEAAHRRCSRRRSPGDSASAGPRRRARALTWFLIALTVIDVDHQLLPDDLTLPLLWLGPVGEPLAARAGRRGLPGGHARRASSAPSPVT